MGWLADRAFDARVSMTAKELLWDIESASELRRAMILAIAQKLRTELFGSPMLPEAVLVDPVPFGRPGIGQYYWNLETLRNEAQAQQEHLQKTLPRLGLALPQFSLDHMKNSRRALEVWMVTLGCVVHAKSRPDVGQSWMHLLGASPNLPQAFDELVRIESMSQAAAGMDGSDGPFAQVDRTEWLRACTFVPPFLQSH